MTPCDSCARTRPCRHYGPAVIITDRCPWYTPDPLSWPWLIVVGAFLGTLAMLIWGLL